MVRNCGMVETRLEPIMEVMIPSDGDTVYLLELWENTGRIDPTYYLISFRLTRIVDDSREVIFEDFSGSYGCPKTIAIDSAECVMGLLRFLVLEKGDTDLEYFDGYTEDQLRWLEDHSWELRQVVFSIENEYWSYLVGELGWVREDYLD